MIVGSLGTATDALVVAALRAAGNPATALPAPDSASLALGRTALPHGYPAQTYALVGTLLRCVRDDVESSREAKAPVTFVTVGGHCAHQGSDYLRALASHGITHVDVLAPSPAMLRTGKPSGLIDRLAGWPLRALMDTVIAGDMLDQLGCATRPLVTSPSLVQPALDAAVGALASALARGAALTPVLHTLGRDLAVLSRRPIPRSPVRVRVTGEYVPSVLGGEMGADVVRHIESAGGIARPPLRTEWLLYLLWQVDPRPDGRCARLRHAIAARFRRFARAAGLRGMEADDPETLATLAERHYSSSLRGSAGHLETGIFLSVERHDLADLVVSVKSFASTPSGSVSDAVVHTLARSARTIFLSVEATGDGDPHVEGRVELAVNLARARRCAAEPSFRARTEDTPGVVP